MWKELWFIESPVWLLLQSEIYFCEKRRVWRIYDRDTVTYVTCYILDVRNKNLPPSLTISCFRAPDGKSTALTNCFLQKYVLLKKGEWVGSVKRILGLWHEVWQKFSPSTPSGALPWKGYYVCCVGCTMRFQGRHHVRPKSGWLLSYSLKGVRAAMVARVG